MPACVKKARRLVTSVNHVIICTMGVRFVSVTMTWSTIFDVRYKGCCTEIDRQLLRRDHVVWFVGMNGAGNECRVAVSGTQSRPPGWINHAVIKAQRGYATCRYAGGSELGDESAIVPADRTRWCAG
jgi:hypothetical protein